MNAPAPTPKDPWSSLLVLAGLGLAAIAVIKFDDVLLELKDRIWKLENPVDAKAPGAQYEQELLEDVPPARPRRPRVVKDAE